MSVCWLISTNWHVSQEANDGWQWLAVSVVYCVYLYVLHTAFNNASGLLSSCSAAALEMALSVSSCRCLESLVGDGCSMYSGSCWGTAGGKRHHQRNTKMHASEVLVSHKHFKMMKSFHSLNSRNSNALGVNVSALEWAWQQKLSMAFTNMQDYM